MSGHPGLPGMKVGWRLELFSILPKKSICFSDLIELAHLFVSQGPQRCQRGSGRTWKTRAQGKIRPHASGIEPMLVNSGQVIRLTVDGASIALHIIKIPLNAAIFCTREQLHTAQTWGAGGGRIVCAFQTRIMAHVPLHFRRKWWHRPLCNASDSL